MALYAWCLYHFRDGEDADSSQQAVWYRNANIPIFISEYGTNSHAPRGFDETPTLYSPPITAVFSGGCVYELWQGHNDYGLALLDSKTARATRGFSSRHKGPDAVAETRQLDSGTLYLYKDFVNYKRRLAETSDVVASTDDVPEPIYRVENWMDCLFGHKPSDDMVPGSCVDWGKLEGDVGLA